MFEARYSPERRTFFHHFDTWYVLHRKSDPYGRPKLQNKKPIICTSARVVRTHIGPHSYYISDNYFVQICADLFKIDLTMLIPVRFRENSRTILNCFNCCVIVTRVYMPYYCLICIILDYLKYRTFRNITYNYLRTVGT